MANNVERVVSGARVADWYKSYVDGFYEGLQESRMRRMEPQTLVQQENNIIERVESLNRKLWKKVLLGGRYDQVREVSLHPFSISLNLIS